MLLIRNHQEQLHRPELNDDAPAPEAPVLQGQNSQNSIYSKLLVVKFSATEPIVKRVCRAPRISWGLMLIDRHWRGIKPCSSCRHQDGSLMTITIARCCMPKIHRICMEEERTVQGQIRKWVEYLTVYCSDQHLITRYQYLLIIKGVLISSCMLFYSAVWDIKYDGADSCYNEVLWCVYCVP